MSDCEDCPVAEANALSVRYTIGCFECTARALANSPTFSVVVEANAITPAYKDALQSMFDEDLKVAHAAVSKWSRRIAAAKQQATANNNE